MVRVPPVSRYLVRHSTGSSSWTDGMWSCTSTHATFSYSASRWRGSTSAGRQGRDGSRREGGCAWGSLWGRGGCRNPQKNPISLTDTLQQPLAGRAGKVTETTWIWKCSSQTGGIWTKMPQLMIILTMWSSGSDENEWSVLKISVPTSAFFCFWIKIILTWNFTTFSCFPLQIFIYWYWFYF